MAYDRLPGTTERPRREGRLIRRKGLRCDRFLSVRPKQIPG